MVELRWLGLADEPTTRLQYRVLVGYMDASGAFNVARAEWSEWREVPEVVLPTIQTVPATKCEHGYLVTHCSICFQGNGTKDQP